MNERNEDKIYDGKEVSIEYIFKNFIINSRNNYLKRTSYISKDGLFCATIYDSDLKNNNQKILIEKTY